MDFATHPVAAPRLPWRTIGVLATIGLLLATALAFYVGSRPRPPAPFGLAANGRLIYVDGGDVFLRSDPAAPAQLFNGDPAVDNAAFFSPQGDRVALLRATEGGEDLVVADADGTNLINIGGPYRAIDWVEWSPDQRYIALSYDRKAVNAIEVVATDGTGSRRLVDFPAMSPTWRPPDGAQLLFRGQYEGRWRFFLVDAAGGEPVMLDVEGQRRIGGGWDLLAPAWSPTGDKLAFHSLVALPLSQLGTPGFRIAIADVGPAGQILGVSDLEFDPVADDELNAVFTPDGRSILFQQRFGQTPLDPSEPPLSDTLWIAPVTGREPATDLGIRSTAGDGLTVTIAPDGTSLIAHLWAEEEDWLVDPKGGNATKTDLGSSSGVSWQRRAP